MAKITSKLQLTVPKAIAEQYGIHPGDEIGIEPAGDVIRMTPPHRHRGLKKRQSTEERLRLFDQGTKRRDAAWQADRTGAVRRPAHRGWRREDLYERAFPRVLMVNSFKE
jgi:AbrB family looped-hinge helix DNA binding protein